MPNWAVTMLVSLVPAILVAIVTSAITVTLALRRFRQERWWERKQATYAELLETLHGLKKYTSAFIDQYHEESTDDERQKEMNAIWKECSAKLSRLEDLASFQLSDRAVALLEEYRQERQAARSNDDFYEWAEGNLAAVERCLERLKEEAKRDLKIG
jgi:hypothetical protein